MDVVNVGDALGRFLRLAIDALVVETKQHFTTFTCNLTLQRYYIRLLTNQT
jgi:hypothetical protein